jgi:cystathionine gamma-synthase
LSTTTRDDDPGDHRSSTQPEKTHVSDQQYGFSTRAITAGQHFDPTTGAVVAPVYMTSTFVQESVGVLRGGYEYARGGNPTRDSLQEQLASLEGGTAAFSFASGLACCVPCSPRATTS